MRVVIGEDTRFQEHEDMAYHDDDVDHHGHQRHHDALAGRFKTSNGSENTGSVVGAGSLSMRGFPGRVGMFVPPVTGSGTPSPRDGVALAITRVAGSEQRES